MTENNDPATTTLSDDLFARTPEPVAETPVTQTPVTQTTVTEDLDYADYADAAPRRSKITTALIVALIFGLGILTGVLLTRAFTPEPAPQIVYVLNDAGSPTASPTPR